MPAILPTLDMLGPVARRSGCVPVFRRLLADPMTPVSAFARLSAGAAHAFLLESVMGGERVARYSFLGARPSQVLTVRRGHADIVHADGRREARPGVQDPFGLLAELTRARQTLPREAMPHGLPALPRFTGGAVGYAAYDAVRYYENLAGGPADDRDLPELVFGLYDDMVVFDHVNKTILIVANAHFDGGDPAAALDHATARIDAMARMLREPAPGEPLRNDFDLESPETPSCDSNLTQQDFEDRVRRAIEHIRAGDIFQVVLSRRLRTRFAGDPFDIYRALRFVNPSPFMFYLRSPESMLIGASPEILCRVEDGVVTNRPLAGTRPRGATAEQDAALERELLADVKDRAEHIMLVDLGRNDVGRVAEPGSVHVTQTMQVERYSHVMHLSSNVEGRLAAGKTAVDALTAALPAGTVSGAPKVRAMQIIDELEPTRRGPYGGAVGYLDFAGNMDTCIALRTMVATPGDRGAWNVDIQAGAGIVADSRPNAEYEETQNKARAMLAAVGMARK